MTTAEQRREVDGSMTGIDRTTVAEAAAVIRRILDAVESGSLTGPAALIYRLEGAAVALEHLGAGTVSRS